MSSYNVLKALLAESQEVDEPEDRELAVVECEAYDREELHIAAEEVLLARLEQLGEHELVAHYRRLKVDFWYA